MKLIPYYNSCETPVRTSYRPLTADLDQIFKAFFPGHVRSADATPVYRPALEVDEAEEHYTVTVEVPGFRKEDLKVELTGDTLTVSGERKDAKRGDIKFSRSVQFPGDVLTDKVSARHEYGVLTLSLPKREEVKPRSIEIKAS